MPLAIISRSHAGYRRRHHWRHADVDAAASATDEPHAASRAPVPGCDVIMPPYGSAFNVVERPADLSTTGNNRSTTTTTITVTTILIKWFN